ncbi:Nicotinate dehydrogenase small FeS subunit [Anatilimnocola aggregata]|uniref:Nicotinate dehydrogenase small FeS subunit n=1 Tax=Anatilimnocola aggregata TaxID=2528021 RepID=A0A517YGI8_9BACT|nr:(2Fe-2S)-binding protein [Anatilimnocola aggregata]QDU29329.1 Nicotinate dehydrogenase small FeS subunit [Anatilimnocola aggregata]
MSPSTKTPERSGGFSRRDFLHGSGAVAAAATLQTSATAFAQQATGAAVVSGETTIELSVNGTKHKVKVEPRTTLLDVLRFQLDLTGAKPICTDGSSGGATILVDGKPMQANIMLAMQAVGKEIATVESLAKDRVPAAFTACDAQQCGFCTPGFVVAVKAFLDKNPKATEEQIRSGLNGNICRCGTYVNVVQAAVKLVKGDA